MWRILLGARVAPAKTEWAHSALAHPRRAAIKHWHYGFHNYSITVTRIYGKINSNKLIRGEDQTMKVRVSLPFFSFSWVKGVCLKDCILHSTIYMASLKRQKWREREQISGYQRLRMGTDVTPKEKHNVVVFWVDGTVLYSFCDCGLTKLCMCYIIHQTVHTHKLFLLY